MLKSRRLKIFAFVICSISAVAAVYLFKDNSPISDGGTIHGLAPQQKVEVYVPPKTLDDNLRIFVDRNAAMNYRVPDDFSSRIPIIKFNQDFAVVATVLSDSDDVDAVRNAAANLLERSKFPGFVESLEKIIDNPKEKPRFRSFAVQHLSGQLSSKDTVVRERVNAKLHQLLADRDVEVRREALLTLVREKDAQATQMAMEWLNDSGSGAEEVKDLAISCAFTMDMQGQIPAIRQYLNSKDEIVRIAAINALSGWYDDESRPAFEDATRSKSVRLQRAGQAATARLDSLERLLPKKEQTVEKLSEMLKNDRLIIRDQAAMGLARFGGEIQPAIPSLTSALKRLDSTCKTAQIVAYLDPIRKAGIRANSAAETIVQLMDERSPVFKERPKLEVYRLRAYMLLTLADIGAARTSVQFIAESLANSDAEMTFNFAVAAHAAGTLGADAYEFTPLLERSLKNDFVDVPLTLVSYFAPLTPTTTTSGRIEAIRALAKIGPGANDAVPMLKTLTLTDSTNKIPSWKADAQKALLAITITSSKN